MQSFKNAADLASHVGEETGLSDWWTVDQEMINRFANVTGDHQWIHVDVERAAREMPGGKTIAHGFLVLSLMASMKAYHVEDVTRGLNYGFDKVRFTSPVPSGSRVRQRVKLLTCDPIDGGGYRIKNQCTVEIEGQERPAVVAEHIVAIYSAS